MGITYKNSGVDTQQAARLVGHLKRLKTSPSVGKTLTGIGPFASAYTPGKNIKRPVIVASCDGVGTKLDVARMAGDFRGVGVDLVAMNVNDVVCAFARPVLFLDYFSTAKLDEKIFTDVMKGIIKGCRLAGCALAGGETAEMPDFYEEGRVELAGFCIGIADEGELRRVPPVEEGDLVLGFHSSGFHSNGYSLLRKLLFKTKNLRISDPFPRSKQTVAQVLLKPTRIYVKEALTLMKNRSASAFVHITGGGFYENIPRVLPRGFRVEIHKKAWTVPRAFRVIQEIGQIDEEEMFRTFNMGVGFIAFVKKARAGHVEKLLKMCRWQARFIGEVTKGRGVRIL